jgi:dipeptidyl aminopeptidase/acylaminoacyl peptidase
LAAAAVGIAAALAAQAPPLVRSHLVWLDRSGKSLGILGDLGDYGDLELSRDGRRVAVALLDQTLGTRDIWMIDVADGRRTRFTSSPADENSLIFSPDGKRVMFNAFSREAIELREAAADGSGDSRVVLTDTAGVWPVSWSPDGRHVVYVRNDQSTGNDVWVLPLFGDRKPFPLLQTRGAENWAAVSPDGRWIAYSSSEAGDVQVYVSRFPEGGRKWLVSAAGGSQARWRRDGKELFYLAPDKRVMAAAVMPGRDDFDVGAIEPLFSIDLPYFPYHAFDVAADGQRFIVNTIVLASGRPGTPARSARRDYFTGTSRFNSSSQF